MRKLRRRFWVACLTSISIAYGSYACAEPAEVADVPANPSEVLKLPPGFKAAVFASTLSGSADYFSGPRMMAFGPDGHLYVTTGMGGKVLMLPDRNHDGKADEVVTLAEGLNAPNGIAWIDGQLFLANQDGIVRLEWKNEKAKPVVVPVVKNLPTGGHTLKTLRQGPDGYLYVNVGSSCNVCDEQDATRATILRYTTDGKPAGALKTVGHHAQSAVWATGLRNSQGFAWQPGSQVMFATNDGADMRSDKKGGPVNDNVPPEHLNLIEGGHYYGWPYCWGNRFADPNNVGPTGYCDNMHSPAATFDAHSTPIGITFLDKSGFPVEYRNDAIVALHGSWNRKEPSGYKLVRVKFSEGKPVEVTDFVTGWLSANQAWGRPVDAVVGPDGALYVSDDRSGLVYRISYGQN